MVNAGGSIPLFPISMVLKAMENINSESEGVFMIITVYGVIVFQLVTWIGVLVTKSSEAAADRKYGEDMCGFAYPAIPTRHEVP